MMNFINKAYRFIFPFLLGFLFARGLIYLTDNMVISIIGSIAMLYLINFCLTFKVIDKLPIFLQTPFYKIYKQRLLDITNAASPFVAYPMTIFIELSLDKIFKEKGILAAKKAMSDQVDKVNAGYNNFFDAMIEKKEVHDSH